MKSTHGGPSSVPGPSALWPSNTQGWEFPLGRAPLTHHFSPDTPFLSVLFEDCFCYFGSLVFSY